MSTETDPKSDLWNFAAVLVVISTLFWWLYGGKIERHFVLKDLRYNATTIRRSEIPIDCREEMLELVYDVADRVRGGNTPGGWDETDEAISEMLRDEIACEEAKLIRLELRRALKRVEDE
jgi:hypothetical protein